MSRSHRSLILACAALGVLAGLPARGAALARPPVRKPAPAHAAPAPGRPAPGAARVPALTPATLGPTLKAVGYAPILQGGYQRLRVEEDGYGYFIDVTLSTSGDWLTCMAHLAPVGDLTKLPSAPLLALLSTNDTLLGMAFSYDRVNAQIMLNASVPNRNLDPASLKSVIEGLKTTVRKHQGLWDTSTWSTP
jgi:hypothetical protein